MFRCPNDNTALARQRTLSAAKGTFWSCPTCGGRTASIGMLRRTSQRGLVDELWTAATAMTEGTRRCPACERPMRAVSMGVRDAGGAAVTLDVCPRCYFVWFDASEFEALPPARKKGAAEGKLPLEAALLLAKAEVEAIDTRPDFELPPSDPPPEGWKMLPAFFGLPVKQEAGTSTHLPLATWGLAVAVALLSLLAFADIGRFAQDFGLIPWQTWRYGGLTLLTSFFLHGSLAHLAVSLYFLVAFGDDVEEVLGSATFLLLLALAAVAGGVLHALSYAASSTPLIGAGTGISGLLAFYGLQYPRARIGFLLRLPVFWFMRWVNVRAWVGVLIWIVLQAIGALRQTGDLTQVSLYAHLGGAATGFLFWFFWPANREYPAVGAASEPPFDSRSGP